MTEVGGAYNIKYKTMTMMIIVVVIVPCPSLSSWSLIVILVPHCRPGPLSLVCVTCVCLWVLAVIYGLWWVVVVGHGSFIGGGSHFCVLAIICVCFGGFVLSGCL